MESSSASPQDTAEKLIDAGLLLFGQQGYEATSTRALAALAQTNIASIAYHFGSKAGLHEACARALCARLETAIALPPPGAPLSQAQAVAVLEALLERLVAFVTSPPESEPGAAFLLRELSAPGPVAELLYHGFIAEKHALLCRLWGAASGQDAESETTRLSVFALIGQVAYFRVARPFVLARMGWDAIGPGQAETLLRVLRGNLHALLERSRR